MSTGYQIKDQSALHYIKLHLVYLIDIFTKVSNRDIIVENLVRAKIVQFPEEYLYSSAMNYAGLDSLWQVEILTRK